MAQPMQWDRQIGRRLRLRDLHVFCTVVGLGSMAKAAAHLGVTQPTVSEVIADLEHAVRMRLLERSAKGVEPTPYGHALLKRAHAAFDELRQGVRDMEFLADPAAGEIRVGCPESIVAGLMEPVIQRLAHDYPRLSVELTDAMTRTFEFPLLYQRKLDLVVARLAIHREKAIPGDLAIEILFEDRLCLVAGANSRWARRRKIDIAELAGEPWIMTPHDGIGASWLREAFQCCGVEMPPGCVTTYSAYLRSTLVGSGRFISVLPLSVVHLNAARFSLHPLPVTLPAPPWHIGIVTLKNRALNPAVGIFLKYLRGAAQVMAKDMEGARWALKSATPRGSNQVAQ